MTPSWVTPETATACVEDLLALMMGGYTVEIVPLDLIGPDRAVLRLTSHFGEPVAAREVRMPSLRDLPAALRQLRVAAFGDESDPDAAAADATPAADDDSRLKMMSAMLGFSAPDWSAPASSDAGHRTGNTDTSAVTQAILGAIRPARTHSGSPDADASADNSRTGPDGTR